MRELEKGLWKVQLDVPFLRILIHVVKFSPCYQSHRSAVLNLSPTSTSSQQAFSLSFLQPAGLFFVISLFHILLDSQAGRPFLCHWPFSRSFRFLSHLSSFTLIYYLDSYHHLIISILKKIKYSIIWYKHPWVYVFPLLYSCQSRA